MSAGKTSRRMFDGKSTLDGFVLDSCHDQIKAGDAFIATYRGTPSCRFEVLADEGGGLFRVRRPDGEESLMRPSTILNVAERVESNR